MTAERTLSGGPLALASVALHALFLGLLIVPIGVRADPMLTIDEVHWTDAVTQARYGQTYDETAPLKPLYLWMRVSGHRDALAELEANGKLPIRHRWFKVVGSGVRFDQATEAINLSIGSTAALQPLRTELATRGKFDWRTWSVKEHLSPGVWAVRLEYATHDPVLCGDDAHVCEFDIQIE